MTIEIKLSHFRVSINVLILFAFLAALFTGTQREYLLTLGFIAAHEAAHMLLAIMSGAKVHSLRILPVGLNAEIQDACCSRGQRILIYGAGPFCSILISGLFFILMNNKLSSISTLGAIINLYLGVFNLIPVLPLDGGRLLMELLSSKHGIFKVEKVLRFLSVVLSLTIIIIGITAYVFKKGNLSLLFIGVYILMGIKKSREEAAFMNIKSFIYKKSRITQKGIYPVRDIVVLKSTKLTEVIKAMDHTDKFHLVHVLDDNFKVVKVLTEQELLDSLIKTAPEATFDNLLHIEYNVHSGASSV